MRVRLAVLILFAVLLCAVAVWAIWQSAVLDVELNHLYGVGTDSTQPTEAELSRAAVARALEGALVQLITPFVTGSMLCITAVLALLAWMWQLRQPERAR